MKTKSLASVRSTGAKSAMTKFWTRLIDSLWQQQAEENIMDKKQRKHLDGVWQDPDSGVWRYRFMLGGQRYFGTVPNAKTKAEAKAARNQRQIAVLEGREIGPNVETNFRLFVIETFLPWVEMNLRPKTYRSYKWRTVDL